LLRLTPHVLAVEAIPELAEALARLLPRATILNIAASSAAGHTTLTIPQGAPGLSSLRDGHFDADRPVKKLTVETRTIDQIVASFGRPVGFIKIDVEGHELEVLKGAEETLATHRPTLLIEAEERHSPGAVGSIMTKLAKLGYAGFFLDRGILRSVASFDLAVHQRFDSADTLALDKGRADFDYVNNFVFIA
jgi:FkbM family methyltransferase